MPTNELPADYLVEHSALLLDSYQRWTGKTLITRSGDACTDAMQLFTAPFGVMSHGIEADPLINYANRTVLTLFETDWSEFIGKPSRLTAEPDRREDRARLLDAVTRDGFSEDYSGIRISFRGARFRIENACVWNLVNTVGSTIGQAAFIPHWTPLSDISP